MEDQNMSIEATLLLDTKCLLGEGPWWDAQTQRLYWIDGFGDSIFLYDPSSGENKTYPAGRHVGCVIPAANGRILAVLQDGIYLLAPDTGELTLLNDIEHEITNNRLNDGKCDSRGRLWFGSMSMTANQPEREFEVSGSFYKYENGVVIKQFGGVGISNGIAWNADETVMYYIDTTTASVFAFDFDAGTGSISNRRAIITFDQNEGLPDGMSIDEEGMLWIAHFGGWRISRWNPNTGKKLDEIPLPVQKVTSCCFGGKNLDTLYMTTARTELTPAELERQPRAGGLFIAKPGVRGRPLHKFNSTP
jgi:sugar lactone lactonase YvrE